MKSLSIHVEPIAGKKILETCQDMVDLAKQLDMMVTADFNGEYMIAAPKMTADQLFTEYNRMLDRKLENPDTKGRGLGELHQ